MKFWNLCLMWQSILRPLVCNYFFVRLKQFPVSFACWLPVFDIFWTTLTNSPRNNLTGHFLPKFWHILPEISSKKIFVLKGLMNKNFFHFLFEQNYFPLMELLDRILASLKCSVSSLIILAGSCLCLSEYWNIIAVSVCHVTYCISVSLCLCNHVFVIRVSCICVSMY